ncbi:hypothetical protein [Pseudovibrio sp. Ad26]|uniref:hypothetical protein n=1 Tax=Pseudovibrio sp. Ad26 TaxID=989410 RepID=UPI0007AEABBB|nr:hypothetical protein [Pseudovibrio sp. Ad26]
MSNLDCHIETEHNINALINNWLQDKSTSTPLQDLQLIIEEIRSFPRGDERIQRMNTLVRTLGRAETLAIFLDALREAGSQTGTIERKLSEDSSKGTMHCIYGWCGQTTLVNSLSHPTAGTMHSFPTLRERLGYNPATWGLSIHIWQPNPNAKGFAMGVEGKSDIVMEPPHSHPFDFVSMLSKGSLKQSIYVEQEDTPAIRNGRYNNICLEKIDGIWPPHIHRRKANLTAVEDQVSLKEGDSYFMPAECIHDVETVLSTSRDKPAITLFFASEATTTGHAYVVPELLEYHTQHPNLKEQARPLPFTDWDKKLSLVSSYLKGETETLNLADVVKYTGDYAFFHRETLAL